MSNVSKICLIGLGEVGGILVDDLTDRFGLSGFDILLETRGSVPALRVGSGRVEGCATAGDAANGAQVIISAVTAAQTLNAAKSICGSDLSGSWFLDMNSASPGMKQQAATFVEGAGGKYVEGAVMSPVPPKRLGTPVLLGGPHAETFLPVAQAIGFSGTSVFSAELGKASAAKMCRSVMVKGIEALLSESLLAARGYGVEDTVLKSLDDLFPGPNWQELSRYMISRTLEHGKRRAEEMREVARTVSEAGLEPHMSSATAERQEWAPPFASALDSQTLEEMLDAIRVMAVEKDS